MIHFYFGEDDLATRRQVDAVARKFGEKYGPENVLKIGAREATAGEILAEIVNIGLFANDRLVILAEVFTNKDLAEKLPAVLARVPDETELIITETRPDKRTKLYKVLTKDFQSKEFQKPKNLVEFVLNEAHSNGVEIQRAAADELIDYTSGDTWRIASEIAKFRALDKVITAENVRQYVEPDLEANAFKLLEDLLNDRKSLALAELGNLRKIENANKFFGLLASQVFALAAAVAGSDKSSAEISRDMGVHPFVMSKMTAVARRVDSEKLRELCKVIADTDVRLKSTGADDWTLVNLAISRF
ncbi:MAG: DNA polymerase III subunit delta [Candidatus Nomurabacteria bacterium]|jgi:DNA polymerase III delta subunit|nr:DNA polymerase III subunit delta [Candidatus Nomurabacteria bacterium]